MRSFVFWTIICWYSTTALAQWSHNGNAVAVAPGLQSKPMAVSDGAGGAIIVWEDQRNFSSSYVDIYAQRIDSNGVALWAPDGVAISQHVASESNPAIVSDNAGGAIITWQGAYGYRKILAQRVNANGVLQWRADGVVVCPAALNNQLDPVIISDNAGGAIIAWYGYPNAVSQWDVWAQRLDANGVLQWPAPNGIGVAVCTAAGSQSSVALASDNAGGAIITWQDPRPGAPGGGTYHVFAQRIGAFGGPQWAADGVAISTAPSTQIEPKIVADNAGGAIVTWSDSRNDASDIYAQRIDASGIVQWSADGIAICTAANAQMAPALVSDDAGGAIVSWTDGRSGAFDIFAQRLNANGEALWMPNGTAVCNAAGAQYAEVIARDGAGGAVITWSDERNGPAGLVGLDIYAQRLSPNGVAQWMNNGVTLCTAADGQTELAIANDEQGGAIVAWTDYRNDDNPRGTSNTDIYAQRTAGLRANLSFFHQIPEIPYFQTPLAIATDGIHPKICADGSQATLISYKVDSGSVGAVHLRVREDPHGDSTSVYGSFSFDPLLSHPPDSLVFRYHHPRTPPPAASTNRTITLEVVDSATEIVKKSNAIDLYRAPVLMVHGLWSDPSTFSVMRGRLASQGWPNPLLFQATYGASHGKHFLYNSWVLPLQLNILVTQARNNKYSTGKVDVIGHSMGGILARLYLQSQEYQNNLNRMITLNTPHSGSQAADFVIRKPELGGILNFFVDVYGGAIADLQVEGPAIRDLLNGSSLNARVTPSHAILTLADPHDQPGVGWADLLLALAQRRYQLPITDLLNRLYDYRPNDLVVPDISQQGGLSTFSIVSEHQPHTGSTAHSDVINRVIQLLNTSTDDLSVFSMSGFDPPLLDYTFDESTVLDKAGLTTSTTGTVTITSPLDGATVTAGQTQPITIAGADDVTALLLAAGNASVGIYSDQQDAPSATFQYPVPQNAAGLIKVLAVGFADSGFAAMDSITLNVAVPATLDSLQIYPNALYLPAGQNLPLSIAGAYHDGISRDLRFQAGVTIESADPTIARIDEQAVVVGVSPGSTTITVHYQSHSRALAVSILAPDDWTTSVSDGRGSERHLSLPKEYLLLQNYPNPFNPATTIRYELPKPSHVTLQVYDLLGREVASLVNEKQAAGEHVIRWAPANLPSGVYLYRLQAGDFVATRKLILVR